MKPEEALLRLIEGNQRFISGVRSVEPLMGHKKLTELAKSGQRPFAIVLTCSDSRSPAEMIFDQSLGDLFVIRVAGNIVAPSLLASMEFAASNFGCSLILVMGHTKCGAVSATLSHLQNPTNTLPSKNLEILVSSIQPAVEKTITRFKHLDENQLLEISTQENVRRSMRMILEESDILKDMLNKKSLGLFGSVLDLSTGLVNWLESDVTEQIKYSQARPTTPMAAL